MDSYEATKMVFSRIQHFDPENASKIMGYLLLQDLGDKEMIRLAFGPETFLHNLILQAKNQLGIPSNSPSTPSTPSRLNPLSISSPRVTNIVNAFDITNPSSPSSSSWPLSSPSNNSTSSLSYASIVNGGCCSNNSGTAAASLSSTVSLSNAFPYYSNNVSTNNNNNSSSSNDLIDEYQLQDHFSFLNDSKPDELFDPRLELAMSPTRYNDTHLYRRGLSVPGMCFGPEDANSGFGWKPCLYFARGFCKNGISCKFLHGESGEGAAIVGSPSKLSEFEQCQEVLLRSKAAAAQQQKLAAAAAASQFMAEASNFPYNKCMNFLLQQQNDTQRSTTAAALMMGEEFHKLGRCRPERSDFSLMGLGGAMNPGSRQIYLTFPADSTFREEDVSNYFSIYGPVQDVRIPYQQKRMFGFVTFVYPETVKIILAKGNPHFVCDSRVLVKPYKEKGKVPDKKPQHQQQQMERCEYSACSSPTGLDSREPLDLRLGARMLYNTQEMLLRKKLEEQADLQQAIQLQGRRLLNLQLLDFKNTNHNHNHHQYLHGFSTGSPIPSPTLSHTPSNPTLIVPSNGIDQEACEDNGGNPDTTVSLDNVADADQEVNPACNQNNGNSNDSGKEEKPNTEETDIHESLEHILPDNLFSSPKKLAGDHHSVFSSITASVEVDVNATSPSASAAASTSSNVNPMMPTVSTLNMTSLKSCFLQMPRFPPGQGTVGM